MSIMTGAAQQAPAAPAPPVTEEPTQARNQRTLLLAGGGLALVIVAALAYFFLLSGGSSDTSTPSVALPAAKPSASASPSAKPAQKPLQTFAGRTARNPFKSLAPVVQAGGATGTGSTDTSTGTGTGTGTGTSTGTTTTPPATSSVPLAVGLKSIKSDKSGATLTVKPQGKALKTYSPALGATFATYFKLNGFLSDAQTGTPQCVLLAYGDATFTLCKGATLTIK